MINVKITMVDGDIYYVKNIADGVKDFYKRVIAPYGTNMIFVEIIQGTLINTSNIVAIREMTEEEVDKLNEPKEPEEVVGLRETEVKVEELETELPEVSQ